MNEFTLIQQQKTPAPTFTPTRSVLQRKCACGQHTIAGGECDECRKKRLQRKSTGHTGPETVPPIVHEVLRSPGQPLDTETRAFMEPRFGHDFSQVRVHTDAKASESAQAVNALAYTVGRDVVFGAGQYAPGTGGGKRLLAHELTHVVQQKGKSTGTQMELTIGAANNLAEREATMIANQNTIGAETQLSDNITRQSVFLQRHSDPDLFIPGENFYFSNQGQARIAALARATQLGPGHFITHDPRPKKGEQPHYHVRGPTGLKGHFFYGRRRQRRVRGQRQERVRARDRVRAREQEQAEREQAERRLRELLPAWIIALLSVAALLALAGCFATGVCEAAIIIGAAGAAAGALIIGIFRSAGVEVTGDGNQEA